MARVNLATQGADGYVGTPGQGGTPLSPSVECVRPPAWPSL